MMRVHSDNNIRMEGVRKMSFGELAERSKALEELRQKGRVQVKIRYHVAKGEHRQKVWWCGPNQTLLLLTQLIREQFRVPQTEGLFLYIDGRIPQKTLTLGKLKGEADGLVCIDAATQEIF